MTSLSDLSAVLDHHAEKMACSILSMATGPTKGNAYGRQSEEWPHLWPILLGDCFDTLAAIVMHVLSTENSVNIAELQEYLDKPTCDFANDVLMFIFHGKRDWAVPMSVAFALHAESPKSGLTVPAAVSHGTLTYHGERYESVTL